MAAKTLFLPLDMPYLTNPFPVLWSLTLSFSRNTLKMLPTCPSPYSMELAVIYQILCLPVGDQ